MPVKRKQKRHADDKINQFCQFGQRASGGITDTHDARISHQTDKMSSNRKFGFAFAVDIIRPAWLGFGR
jgi:hypothetical protein